MVDGPLGRYTEQVLFDWNSDMHSTSLTITQMLAGCLAPLTDLEFTKHNRHPNLLRDMAMPSREVGHIVHDIVSRAVKSALALGSLAYVETYYVRFPNSAPDEREVSLHLENAFLVTMQLCGVLNPRAAVELEFKGGEGCHFMRLRLSGLVLPL